MMFTHCDHTFSNFFMTFCVWLYALVCCYLLSTFPWTVLFTLFIDVLLRNNINNSNNALKLHILLQSCVWYVHVASEIVICTIKCFLFTRVVYNSWIMRELCMCHRFNCCILFSVKNEKLENESAINAFIITIYVGGFPTHYLF